MSKKLKVKAWGIIAHYRGEDVEIGAGERGKKYVYWDKEAAEHFIKVKGYWENEDGEKIEERWRVVPVEITYDCG